MHKPEVFILFGYYDEVQDIIGVYRTMEAARRARDDCKDSDDGSYLYDNYGIEGKYVYV